MNHNNILSTIVSAQGDEYYTLPDVAKQICDNIIDIPELKVWLPFNDLKNGVWDKALRDKNFHTVITSGDFFDQEKPDGVQAIISNPPFSRKKEILDRIKDMKIKFVLILPFTWLNDTIPMEYGHQIMLFRRRMHFEKPGGGRNKPRCNCFVLSNGLLKTDFSVVWD